jgi:glyoxylase-like metal-dependent hydrolase (beta-lactamase superfamily II)
MTATHRLSRRGLIALGASLPLAAPFIAASSLPALAQGAAKGPAVPTFSRFRLGTFEVTTILGGTRTVANPQETFGTNVSAEEFAAAAQAAFLPTDKAQFFFTPTLVDTGSEVVLFDTGLAGEATVAALADAGYTPDQVSTVVLTHMHGDHIGGLMTGDAPTFANARYMTGAAEHNHWMAAANEGFDKNVRPLSDKMTMIDDGGSVTGGITGIAAFGHTPGHMVYRVESDGQAMMVTADTANHFAWSLAKPDWEVRFDADKAGAAATRRAVFGMIADERMPFVGYHMPFPALGYVERDGDGFRYVPASYQLIMGEPA